jgi:hypothetical protein
MPRTLKKVHNVSEKHGFLKSVDRENSLDQCHRVMVLKNICKNYFSFMKQLILDRRKKHNTILMLIKIGLHSIRNGNNCYFLQ